MKKLLTITFTFLFVATCEIAHSQRIEDLEDPRPLGTLASGEIHIINLTSSSVDIQYSLDSHNWKRKAVSSKDGIVATLDIKDNKLYVKICNKIDGAIHCDQYPLRPKKRYVIDSKDGLLILKNG